MEIAEIRRQLQENRTWCQQWEQRDEGDHSIEYRRRKRLIAKYEQLLDFLGVPRL
jgi:hypothetical protein